MCASRVDRRGRARPRGRERRRRRDAQVRGRDERQPGVPRLARSSAGRPERLEGVLVYSPWKPRLTRTMPARTMRSCRGLLCRSTQAFNVRLLRSDVEVYPNTYVFSEPSTWTPVSRATTRSVHTDPNETTTVFPNSPVYCDIEISSRVIDWRFEAYTKKHFYIAVAARLEYCDGNRSLHWTPRFSLRRTSPCSAAQHRCASTPESPTTPSARTRPRGSRERRPNALTGPHPAGQAPCGPFWRIDRYWMPLHVVADGPDASPRQRRFVARR